MISHTEISRERLQTLIQRGEITFAGNRNLKVYGLLTCVSGKRMKKENRVFFKAHGKRADSGTGPAEDV